MRFVVPLLASALVAHALPAAPGEAAIRFLERVRENKVNLEPGGDTAISPQTADAKKRQIARRLERTARDLGSDPLEIGTVKEDGNFAAVIVRKTGGFDPSRLQVFPVAVVKKDDGWAAAPVPASFENAGTGYSISLREKLESLENWMLRQQVVDLEKLREQAALEMRGKIETRLTAGQLRGYDAEKTGEAFVTACAEQDLPRLLGLLGGLASRLPDDWAARLKAAERAMAAGPDADTPWRYLQAPEILRVPVHHEQQGDKGLFSIACLDPATDGSGSVKPRIHVLHLELSRSADGLWQIDLPTTFLLESARPADPEDEDVDTDLVQRFAREWERSHPPTAQPTPELARNMLVSTLQDASPANLLRMASLRTTSESASADCLGATHFWSPFHDKSTFRSAIPLTMKTGESAAVGLLQVFSSRDTTVTDIRPVYFEKKSSGWLWTPIPRNEVIEEFKEWVKTETEASSGIWQERLLSGVVILGKEFRPAPEDQARTCVESWLAAIREGNLEKALSFSARLSAPSSDETTLRNTGYEILAVRRTQQSPAIQGIYTGKSFSAAGAKVSRDGKSLHPLYPVVTTASGPRILIQTDLIASGNRSRDYLNRESLGHLQKSGGAEVADDLKALLDRFQTDIANGSSYPASQN
ncbi:MAG: hypothetical protein EOP88_02460 [Verrucomicrobiaceae bacterium]|nr:MAG: hypothetical protein EOP88_02460 [Verrucomicrobiaceae bacterium]